MATVLTGEPPVVTEMPWTLVFMSCPLNGVLLMLLLLPFFFALGFLLLVAVGHACLAKDVLMAYRFAVQHVIILAPFPLFTTGPNFVLHTRAKFYFRDECANPTWHS